MHRAPCLIRRRQPPLRRQPSTPVTTTRRLLQGLPNLCLWIRPGSTPEPCLLVVPGLVAIVPIASLVRLADTVPEPKVCKPPPARVGFWDVQTRSSWLQRNPIHNWFSRGSEGLPNKRGHRELVRSSFHAPLHENNHSERELPRYYCFKVSKLHTHLDRTRRSIP